MNVPRRPSGRAALTNSAGGPAGHAAVNQGIPEATVARLPVYLRALHALSTRGVATASSEELAATTGVNSAKLRKDLSHLGSYGTRGVGYDVEYLIYQISRELGLTQNWSVIIIGAGNLGRALAQYGGFASRGFRVAALLDADPAKVGERIAALTVESIGRLEAIIEERDASIAVIATPAGSAQSVCDRVVGAGVTSVLNFAPVVLSLPPGIRVRKVDLSIELQILAFHEQRKDGLLEAEHLLPMEPDAPSHGSEPAPVTMGQAKKHARPADGRARKPNAEWSEQSAGQARLRARRANTEAVEA